MALSHLLLRRLQYPKPFPYVTFIQFPTKFVECFSSAAADSTQKSPPTPKTNSLTARMSFVFDELVEMDKQGDEKHQTLQRIRSWRQSKNESTKESVNSPVSSSMEDLKTELVKSEALMANSDVKKEVELVHPWPEWIELMERLVQHNYFDHMRKDEDGMMQGLGLDLSEAGAEVGSKDRPFTRDFKAVQAAMVNFGRDRFDILRKLSRQDIQILVGYGCPSEEKKAVFSSKLLRKHVHLDEGDVCSSCNLRSTCEKAYLLTNKEDEPQTLDIMRVLLAYGFDPVNGSFLNKSLLKMKSVKTVVRKLIHEVVKLSAVPLDPNLPRPVIKKAPPKVKTPPPPPRKRVGRSDVEMKKGDWLCPKCDFMNFAKNTICMQCDAKRPKRQLLPGEWECPQCNFLNYRRNTVCFHCEHNRPPDTYAVKDFTEQQNNPSSGMAKSFGRKEDVSNAWNFDFDDNESDGADVAAFEYADSQKIDRDFSLDKQNFRENSRGHQDNRSQREYSDPTPARPSTGFNDFDEDEDDVDSFEVVSQNEAPNPSRINLSELESDSESEDDTDKRDGYKKTNNFQAQSRKPSNRKPSFSDDSDDNDLPVHPKWKSSHVADGRPPRRGGRGAMSFGSDDELGSSSGSDDEDLRSPRKQGNGRGSNRTGRMTRPQSKFSDSDDDFDNSRNNRRDNVGRASMGRGGFKRSSGFDRNGRGSREDVDDWPEKKGRSFDKRDGFVKGGRSSEKRGGLFGKRGGSFDDRGGGSFGKKGGSFEKRGGSFDDKHESFGERGGSFDDRGRSSGKRGGSFEKRGGSFEKRGGSFEKRGGSFERRGGSSGKRGGSFDKRGGRSNNYDNGSDNFPDDERHSRPRNNVR